MTKLRELEQRLRDEPDNLGLRVMVAGALHEAGRRGDAVELYRSVAIAYRDQGRTQQAIAVCRSILELAPDDAACQVLLASLIANLANPRATVVAHGSGLARPSPPPRTLAAAAAASADDGDDLAPRSSSELTPLPVPLAYHEAEPTTGSIPVMRLPEPAEPVEAPSAVTGIAAAARQISASLIAATGGELDDTASAAADHGAPWRRARAARSSSIPVPPPLPRPDSEISRDAVTRVDTDTREDAAAMDDGDDDEPTLPPGRAVTVEDELTEPRELPARVRSPSAAPPSALDGALFAPLPPHSRAAVLQRFLCCTAAPGTAVIRRGDAGHGLVVVVRGRLELAAERDGVRVVLGAVGPGEFVGEADLLARRPASVAVVATTECELLVLAPSDFQDVITAFPALRAELERVAAQRASVHGDRR